MTSSSESETVQKERVRWLNKQEVNKNGSYVLYWMQSSVRCRSNHALEFAAQRANLANKPLLVFFGLVESIPFFLLSSSVKGIRGVSIFYYSLSLH